MTKWNSGGIVLDRPLLSHAYKLTGTTDMIGFIPGIALLEQPKIINGGLC